MANLLVASLIGKPEKSVKRLFICGMILKTNMNLVQNDSDHFGNSQRSLLSPTGGVKSTTSPIAKNGFDNCIYSMNDTHMSNEDNHDTNYINKYTNHDTRKLHL